MSRSLSQNGTLTKPADSGIFANAGLSRWRRKLISRAADLKIIFVGDSTSDPGLIASNIATRMQNVHTATGQGLSGMTPANITMVGHAGLWQEDWSKNAAYVKEVASAQPDLIVYSLGINSIKTGGRSQRQVTDGIAADVKLFRAQVPGADIILRVPNSFSSDDVGGAYVSPNASAQAYTDSVRDAYLALDGVFPNVVVWNSQDRVFGRTSRTFANFGGLLSDQIHPSIAGYNAIADALVADLIGIPPKYVDAVAGRAPIDMYAAQRGIPKYTVGDIVSRADNATSAGTATTGQAYTNNVGTVGVIGGRLYAPGSASVATVDAALSDGDFGVTFTVIDTSGGGGCMFVFRLQDASNYMYLRRYGASLYMGKIVAGTNTQLGNVSTVTAANGDRLAVNCSGSTIKAYLNDALMFTATSTDLTAATRIGVQINGSTFRAVDLFARAL